MSKILLIEDEEMILESTADYLEQEGYECLKATNGTEGIALAKKEIPDIILCDIKMPGLNGHQVLTELRNNSRTSTIPFIFLSALVEQQDMRTGMTLGADDYITKPFQPDDLISSIETRLEKYAILRRRMENLKDSISLSLPHELQTPLVTIMGYAEMLFDKFKNSSDRETLEFSQAILQAGLRLNRLIKNFIFYGNLELMSGDKNLAEQKKNYSTITPELTEVIATKVAERYNRQKDLVIKTQKANILLPEDYFSILLEELLDNAFKFSERDSKILIESFNKDGLFTLKIRDEGRGMKKEQISGIGAYLQFERDKYEQQGMGLGLVISMKIAEIFDGELNIKSEYGKYTEVIASFPSN